MKISLGMLVRATGGSLVLGQPSVSFQRISIDTRTLRPGDAFFAIRGPRFDGHDFLRTAVEKGAAALIVDTLDERVESSPYPLPPLVQVQNVQKALQDAARFVRSRSKARFIGITGSNGKTTTKEMLAAILRHAGKTLATKGNLNNQLGLPLTICELEADHQFAVIEMGTSKPGDMDLLADIARPEVGLITNVGKDHLEFLGSPEGVLNVNRVLWDRLPADGAAIVNVDDPLLAPLAGSLSGRTLTYGRSPQAAVRATDIQARLDTVHFKLHLGPQTYPAELPVSGAFQVLNALAAAAAAHAVGASPDNIVEGLRSFQPAAMRMQIFERPDGSLLINDAYNANPSSMKAVLESFFESYPDRPRWVVLGDMRELGPIARQEHEDLGRWLAGQPVERILLYGRDVRFIQIGAAAEGAAARVERFRKKRYLIECLQQELPKNKPVVLFKASRGMKLEQVIQPLTPEFKLSQAVHS